MLGGGARLRDTYDWGSAGGESLSKHQTSPPVVWDRGVGQSSGWPKKVNGALLNPSSGSQHYGRGRSLNPWMSPHPNGSSKEPRSPVLPRTGLLFCFTGEAMPGGRLVLARKWCALRTLERSQLPALSGIGRPLILNTLLQQRHSHASYLPHARANSLRSKGELL